MKGRDKDVINCRGCSTRSLAGILMSMLPIILLIVVFYFMIIRRKGNEKRKIERC